MVAADLLIEAVIVTVLLFGGVGKARAQISFQSTLHQLGLPYPLARICAPLAWT